MPIRLVRRPRSPYWILRGTVRGVRVEESTGVTNKKIAEEIRAKRESEILTQSVYGRAATATFAQATLSYLENGGNRRFLDKVLEHFGTMPLAKIDLDAIERGARKVYPNVRVAGIRGFTVHDCRHTWATWHYAENRDVLALQRLGGWKTLAMVTRYAHINTGELAHTIDKLPWAETGGFLGDSASEKAKSA